MLSEEELSGGNNAEGNKRIQFAYMAAGSRAVIGKLGDGKLPSRSTYCLLLPPIEGMKLSGSVWDISSTAHSPGLTISRPRRRRRRKISEWRQASLPLIAIPWCCHYYCLTLRKERRKGSKEYFPFWTQQQPLKTFPLLLLLPCSLTQQPSLGPQNASTLGRKCPNPKPPKAMLSRRGASEFQHAMKIDFPTFISPVSEKKHWCNIMLLQPLPAPCVDSPAAFPFHS